MHKLTLRVDDPLHQRLTEAAERDGRSVHGQMIWMLKEQLDNPAKQPIISGRIAGVVYAHDQEAFEAVKALQALGIPVVPPGQIEAEVAEGVRDLRGGVPDDD